MMFRFSSILFLMIPSLALAADPHTEFAFGVLAESRGNPAEAGKRYEAARVNDPNAFPLVQRAVKARMAVDDRAGAVKLYRDLAAARPDELGIQLTYADFLDQVARGDTFALKLSDDALGAALEKNPGNPEIIRRLFQHAGGNKPRQLELLERLSKEDPSSALLYSSLTKSMAGEEDAASRKAIDERLQAAFEANPGDPKLAMVVSEHYRETNRLVKAIEILERHTEVAPSSLEQRTRLGVLYFSANKDQLGEATLKEVLDINPKQALAHQALAKFYRTQNQPEPARLHAGELMKLRGGTPMEYLKLADESLAAGQPKEARLLLERAVFDHPGDRSLAEKLAIATRQDPETREQAARLFREAEAAKTPGEATDPTFLAESADALIDQGELKSAEDRLRTAIRSYPAESKKETAAALRKLAALWEQQNRNADAAKALRQRADALDR